MAIMSRLIADGLHAVNNNGIKENLMTDLKCSQCPNPPIMVVVIKSNKPTGLNKEYCLCRECVIINRYKIERFVREL